MGYCLSSCEIDLRRYCVI